MDDQRVIVFPIYLHIFKFTPPSLIDTFGGKLEFTDQQGERAIGPSYFHEGGTTESALIVADDFGHILMFRRVQCLFYGVDRKITKKRDNTCGYQQTHRQNSGKDLADAFVYPQIAAFFQKEYAPKSDEQGQGDLYADRGVIGMNHQR